MQRPESGLETMQVEFPPPAPEGNSRLMNIPVPDVWVSGRLGKENLSANTSYSCYLQIENNYCCCTVRI